MSGYRTMESDGRTAVRLKSFLAHPCMDVMNFLNEAAERYPNAISLAAGRPPDLFVPPEAPARWTALFVRERARCTGVPETAMWRALGQYGPTMGSIGQYVARWLDLDEGLAVEPSTLMITNGIQEALFLVLSGLCDGNRDVILTDDPCYVGLKGAATAAGVRVVTLTGNDSIVEKTRRAVTAVKAEGHCARALYVIPDFSNPLGRTLTLGEREGLLELAKREEMLLIEDTVYRVFRYEGQSLPTLKAMDSCGVVLQLGSFSKLFMPAPRIGYLVAEQRAEVNGVPARGTLAEELAKTKSFVSVVTSPLMQALVAGFLIENNYSLMEWNRPRIALCKRNRDALLAALAEEVGSHAALRGRVHWTRPDGGFFISLTLPCEFGTDEMINCARDYGVIVCPMSYFSSQLTFGRNVRLSFSNISADQAREGVERLLRFVLAKMGTGQCREKSSMPRG